MAVNRGPGCHDAACWRQTSPLLLNCLTGEAGAATGGGGHGDEVLKSNYADNSENVSLVPVVLVVSSRGLTGPRINQKRPLHTEQ